MRCCWRSGLLRIWPRIRCSTLSLLQSMSHVVGAAVITVLVYTTSACCLHSWHGKPKDCVLRCFSGVRQHYPWCILLGVASLCPPATPGTSCYLAALTFLAVLQILRRSFPGKSAPDNPNLSVWEVMKDSASAIGCGGLAGTVMWSAVLPLDVAKTRIQTAYPVRALSL